MFYYRHWRNLDEKLKRKYSMFEVYRYSCMKQIDKRKENLFILQNEILMNVVW